MSKIKFYPFNEGTSSFAPPPKPASKLLPNWYKEQPASVGDDRDFLPRGGVNSTIKRCMPVFDLLTAGYIISFPMDLYIDATNPDRIEWSVPIPLKNFGSDMVATHTAEQVSSYPIDRSIYHKDVFRILPFWSVGTEPGYSTLFCHPFHRDDMPFHAFSAIVDTDGFISDGHLSMFIKKDFKGLIKQGTPLVQVIPFKREEWQSELVEVEESNKALKAQRLAVRSMFRFGYKEKYRSRKDYK
jgi:hypothetical protein